MGRSGYTSLSLKTEDYKRIREKWDKLPSTGDTFTVWASKVLEGMCDFTKIQSEVPNLSSFVSSKCNPIQATRPTKAIEPKTPITSR